MPPEPVRILAVDDVPENLAALDALLRREGLELVKASSGTEALELLLVHDFALALLDVQMPGMDGFELAELMRGTGRTRQVPIIFLTAVATDERRRFRGYEAGAVDYLLKPVDPHIVRNKVGVFVELFRQRRELAQQRDALAAALARINAHGDNSPLAIVEFDAEQRIIAWSAGAERLFGWRAAQVAGFRPSDFEWLDQADATPFAELIDDMIAGHRLREMQPLAMRTAEGVTLDCECYCSALLDASGGLVSVNVQILDVTSRKRAEETRKLLIGELNHRVKNTLASVQAIATQTLRHSAGPSEFAPTFIGRIHALARAHALLSATTWRGASLRELVEGQLHIGAVDAERLEAEGPDLDLAPEAALHLALVLHELVTNAHKYGALSVPDGKVSLRWRVGDGMLVLDWAETGGKPAAPPSRRGFGTALIERSLKAEGGSAEASYGTEGMAWKLTLAHAARPGAPSKAGDGPAAGRASRAAHNRAAREALQNKRFLVIEDEPLVALELVSILKDAGADILGPVATAEEALDTVMRAHIDAALLDGNLQGTMVDAIAGALAARRIPFLFVSGYGRDHLPAGFDQALIIGKPFDADHLIEAAGRILTEYAGG